ncbi:MAG: hypothetical protein AAF244_01510 [Pseudomonadota bacterium]
MSTVTSRVVARHNATGRRNIIEQIDSAEAKISALLGNLRVVENKIAKLLETSDQTNFFKRDGTIFQIEIDVKIKVALGKARRGVTSVTYHFHEETQVERARDLYMSFPVVAEQYSTNCVEGFCSATDPNSYLGVKLGVDGSTLRQTRGVSPKQSKVEISNLAFRRALETDGNLSDSAFARELSDIISNKGTTRPTLGTFVAAHRVMS